jgi:hypothetical protein
MSTKHKILINEVISKALPDFADQNTIDAVMRIMDNYPKVIDVENLVEYSLARLGGYKFVDEQGRDFDDIDDSDSKTSSVNVKTRKIEIGSIENKIGSLRITITNTLSIVEPVSFLYIPRDYVPIVSNKCYGKQNHKRRLQITWAEDPPKYLKSTKNGYFNKFERFRINTFEELALMTDEKFYELNPLMKLNISLLDLDLPEVPKTDPNEQMSIPCILDFVQQKILTSTEIPPTYLSEKS